MKEQEYKFITDEETFSIAERLLISRKCEMSERIHINYYYDTDLGSLFHNNITLRIRQTEESLLLQLKRRIALDNGLFTSEEEAFKIDSLKSEIISLPNNEFIKDDDSYKLQGSLTTWRRIYTITDGIKAVFDSNYYLGIFDREIEFELSGGKSDEAERIISMLRLNKAMSSKLGKYERFFTRKENI